MIRQEHLQKKKSFDNGSLPTIQAKMNLDWKKIFKNDGPESRNQPRQFMETRRIPQPQSKDQMP